ncbi:cadherin-like beta sandwich domain-containing protein, partial [bacterium]|nr:cadherin-like beta sandwich domain-containing protein [bacterium]
FDFKVTSNISMNSSIGYQVTARKKTGSTLANSAVKVYLTEVNGTEQELLLSKYSELDQTDKVDSSKYDERILYEATVPANTKNYEKNFRLRMWVDENTDFSDGSMNDKTFTLTVNVYADGKVVTDNLDTTNTLDSITVSDCTLDSAFNSATTEYSCTVKNNVESVNVNATATSTKSKVRGLGAKDLTVGKNTLPIRVIAEDGSEKIYNVNVTRKGGVTSLKNEIMGNKIITSTPTLTTSSNNTSDASGLYKSTATNTGESTYYFRGNVENNYVSFAGFTWRIVRINEDGTIRIVMQDGINSNANIAFNSNYNNYTYMYYTNNSNAKTQLESWYQTNIGSKTDLASKVVSGNYYCEQAKAKAGNWTSESATMTIYDKYTPDFKCSSDGNGKGVVNASVGLLTYDEVVYAGGYYDQSNSNYYLNNPAIYWWTMSPAGSTSLRPLVWYVSTGGFIFYNGNGVEYVSCLRPVLNIIADTQISDGDGTKENPFTIQ